MVILIFTARAGRIAAPSAYICGALRSYQTFPVRCSAPTVMSTCDALCCSTTDICNLGSRSRIAGSRQGRHGRREQTVRGVLAGATGAIDAVAFSCGTDCWRLTAHVEKLGTNVLRIFAYRKSRRLGHLASPSYLSPSLGDDLKAGSATLDAPHG